MSEERNKHAAEDALDNLARIMLDCETEKEGQPNLDAEPFLARAMDLVNNWRREQLYAQGHEKRKRFDEFAQAVRRFLQGISDQQTVEQISHIRPDMQSAFYRKLEALDKTDLESARLEETLLSLWNEFCQTEGNGSE